MIVSPDTRSYRFAAPKPPRAEGGAPAWSEILRRWRERRGARAATAAGPQARPKGLRRAFWLGVVGLAAIALISAAIYSRDSGMSAGAYEGY